MAPCSVQADRLPLPITDIANPTVKVGHVEPEIRLFADERTLQESVHALVNVLAQLRHARLGDAAHAHIAGRQVARSSSSAIAVSLSLSSPAPW
jgi:hypothetical protein